MLPETPKAKSNNAKQAERARERALISRCKDGEHAAFDELVRRYERRVFSFAYRLAGNQDDANDVAQEAFIRVFNSIATFRGDAVFTTWIYRIVTNVYLDERKKSKSHRQTSLDDYVELDENPVARQIVDDRPTPDQIVEHKERNRVVQEAVNSLPEYQRIIVTLYHMQNRSYEEIAEILQLPIGTVKSRLNRARLALGEKLQSRPELFG
ncbi:MAG: RNA polymerase subunit sigma-24 [Armatimonadetes bacterium RBG_16_58_9]|nr:MAG: RNA polymerase subunit sigma-24 [Armatimonadetes bacterium RBG_16_58_9]